MMSLHAQNHESREFTLGDGVVLHLFLFLIRLCRETSEGPRGRDRNRTIEHNEKNS